MKNVIEVSTVQLGSILAQIERAVPVTVVAKTVVGMNKGRGENINPFYNKIYKTQESNVFVAMDYETAVNRRLIKEGKDPEFEVSARKWGENIGKSPIISNEKNGVVTHYMQCYFVTNNKPKVSYEILNDDNTFSPIDKATFEDYLKPVSSSNSQGLDNEIMVRTFKLENILEVHANGNIYVIKD